MYLSGKKIYFFFLGKKKKEGEEILEKKDKCK